MRSSVIRRRSVVGVLMGVAVILVLILLGQQLISSPAAEDALAQGIAVLSLVMVPAVPFGLLGMLGIRLVRGAGRSWIGGHRDEQDRDACPDCGQGIESHWEACPFCGADPVGSDDPSRGPSHTE